MSTINDCMCFHDPREWTQVSHAIINVELDTSFDKYTLQHFNTTQHNFNTSTPVTSTHQYL